MCPNDSLCVLFDIVLCIYLFLVLFRTNKWLNDWKCQTAQDASRCAAGWLSDAPSSMPQVAWGWQQLTQTCAQTAHENAARTTARSRSCRALPHQGTSWEGGSTARQACGVALVLCIVLRQYGKIPTGMGSLTSHFQWCRPLQWHPLMLVQCHLRSTATTEKWQKL